MGREDEGGFSGGGSGWGDSFSFGGGGGGVSQSFSGGEGSFGPGFGSGGHHHHSRQDDSGFSFIPALAGGLAGGVIGSSIFGGGRGGGGSSWFPPEPQSQVYMAQQPNAPPVVGWVDDGRRRTSLKPKLERIIPYLNIGVLIVAAVLLFGVFGSQKRVLGVAESRLLTANSIFVDSITVTPLSGSSRHPLQLFMFEPPAPPPPLSRENSWQEEHPGVVVRNYGYHSWAFYLNPGSVITMDYILHKSEGIYLVVLKGEGRFMEWRKDPEGYDDYEYKSWITGEGSPSVLIDTASDYYVVLGNVRRTPIELDLRFELVSTAYDTEQASGSCGMPPHASCHMRIPLGTSASAVLTTPPSDNGTRQESPKGDGLWTVRISYGVRWVSYLILVVGTYVTTALWVKHLQRERLQEDVVRLQSAGPSEQTPFLHSGSTTSSMGVPGLSADPGNAPFWQGGGGGGCGVGTQGWGVSPQSERVSSSAAAAVPGGVGSLDRMWLPGVQPSAPPLGGEGQAGVGGGRWGEGTGGGGGVVPRGSGDGSDQCVICMDAPKNAIFDPCGHRAACITCANRLRENNPYCPICRMGVQKIIRVYDS